MLEFLNWNIFRAASPNEMNRFLKSDALRKSQNVRTPRMYAAVE
jgi:hypothetical protein